MGKFSSLVPGRKKHAPKVAPSEPLSKAHRILGSTPLNIDGPKGWDSRSSSAVSVSVGESSDGYYSPGRRADDGASGEASCGEEMDGLPSQDYRRNIAYDPKDPSTGLRSRQSSSTIKSWYDRSTLTHKPSSSSMSKAHRMLDMDNSHATIKSKKKPKVLDLSSLGRSRSSKTPHDQYDPSGLLRSPSMSSPPSPNTARKLRKFQKQPTRESLRSQGRHDDHRPETSGSTRTGGANNSSNGLHNLYDHYEQMSLRQLMDFDDNSEKRSYDEPQSTQPIQPAPTALPTHREELEPIFEPTLEPTFDMLQSRPPQTARTETSGKSEQASSGDYAASISSRHTRTSRASKHTDLSMQEADLQGKSVLLLSSDSEDDTYADSPVHSPVSVSTRRTATTDDEVASLERFRAAAFAQASGVGVGDKRASRSSKRTSFAPATSYLNSPAASSPQPASIDSHGSSAFMNPFHSPMAPSRGSTTSGSSTGTATTRLTPSIIVQEAHAVSVLPIRGPAVDSEHESESDSDYSQAEANLPPDPTATASDQPTPPLSPTSVDFYIRSGHSSIDGPGTSSRFMAVSRQEEMLLAALRQKRLNMREPPIAEGDEQSALARRKHGSRTSETTITAATFDFDFPTPPGAADKIPDVRDDDDEEDSDTVPSPDRRASTNSKAATNPRYSSVAGPILSPSPTRPLPRKGILKNANPDPPEQSEHILLCLDRPVNPGMTFDEPEPSPDLSDFVDYDDPAFEASSRMKDAFLPVPRPLKSHELVAPRRTSLHPPSTRKRSPLYESPKTARIAEEVEDDEGLDRSDSDNGGFLGDGDFPREDSPISPESFPAVPQARMTLNKLARLSAVGPGTLGAEPGWWGDSD